MEKVIRFILIVIILSYLLVGCAANFSTLDAPVNDPIMSNISDEDEDLSQIEDGSGSSGQSGGCPT